MIGYVRAATASVRPHGDLLAVIDSFSSRRSAPVSYARFGARIAPIPAAGASAYARTEPYDCRGCDNQESRIDEVLKVVRQPAAGRLTLVVTDLWLNNTAFMGSSQVALGGPLTDILRQGRSVGVIGIRAPYSGKIYDLSSQGPYAGARERPLFILAIGSEAEVGAFYSALIQSGSPSFAPDRLQYSLFSPASGNPWRAAPRGAFRAEGVGAIQGAAVPSLMVPGLQQFRYKPGKGGRIVGVIDAAQGTAPGAVWSGPLSATTRVWMLSDPGGLKRCKAGTWVTFAPLRGAWTTLTGRPTSAQLALTPRTAAGLAVGRTYLIAGYLGATTLNSPNPANKWMRDWSFTPAQEAALVRSHPSFFKVLNLADLASILEASVDRVKPPSGRVQAATAFLVKVER